MSALINYGPFDIHDDLFGQEAFQSSGKPNDSKEVAKEDPAKGAAKDTKDTKEASAKGAAKGAAKISAKDTKKAPAKEAAKDTAKDTKEASAKGAAKTPAKEAAKAPANGSRKNGAICIVTPANVDPAFVVKFEAETHLIQNSIQTISRSFLVVGACLYKINRDKLYLFGGYKNTSEYAEKLFGFKKSSTSNYMAIFEKFCVCSFGGIPDLSNPDLKEEYRNFSYSQLSEMLTFPLEKIKTIDPSMTIKEIRQSKNPASEPSFSVKSTPDPKAFDKDFPPALEIFNRTLDKNNINVLIKLLYDHIGEDIQVVIG